MLKTFLTGILILIAGVSMARPKPEKIFPYKYSTAKLDNGLSVVLVPMESPGLVSYYSVVRTGSRDEWEPGKSGFAHFFEHMMFRGTDKYPGPVYDGLITSLGADANAYTSDDLTVFHLNFASDDLEKVIELESDRFQNLKYDVREFQTESGAVYGEYRKGRTSPWEVAFEKLQDMAFLKHTYKHTTIGFEQDIKDMPNMYDYSISFFKRYYRPENVVILVVGDFKKDNVLKLIKKYYSSWQPGYVSPQITPEPPQTQERSAVVSYPGKTLPLLVVSYKGDAFDVNNKNILSSVLIGDLAFGETSDIYKKLVLKEQKVQFIQADFGFSRDPKLLYIYSMVKDPKDVEYVKNEIYKTLSNFQNILVDNKKLNDLKKKERYSFLMHLDTPDNVAGFLPQFITLTGGIDVVDRLYSGLDKVTPEDILQAAKYYFMPEKRNVVLVRGEN
ncbi:MAG: insulinase family protein [Ignavibacteria bacterium]|jgi:zinc protease|nr:insulinase family protein [Ignavibacteria bacterium]MCU7516904.1 insulinase family protein [Ignavibacteria bacterium]